MKEFIIKNDTIQYDGSHLKKDLSDFKFLTNDNKDDVEVHTHYGNMRIGPISTPFFKVKKDVIHSDSFDYDHVHSGYLQYLEFAYDKDFGIIVKPDYIWFTILCEISRKVNQDPETFRKYFTKGKGKIELNVPTTGDGILPVDSLMDEIIKRLPQKLGGNLIVPKFSTSDDKSRFAFKSAFLEISSPFYQYGTYWCGFNKIKLLGTQKDYLLIKSTLNEISEIIPELKDYSKKCTKIINKLIKNWNNVDFWKEICKTEYGYAKHDVDGWFTGFYMNESKSQESFPKHVVKINWKQKHDGLETDFTMYVGILLSKIEDGYLIPDFNKVIAKKVK